MKLICPVCQSIQNHSLCEAVRDFHDTFTYQIMECDRCHLHQTNPFPTDINTANTVNDWSLAPNKFNRYLKSILNSIEIRKICRTTNSKRILDIGSGFGEFSETAYKLGCDVIAADSFDRRPYCLQSLPSVPYLHFDWETHSLNNPAQIAKRTIILRHVLEHVSDPLKFLNSFINNKAEYFYILVPNYKRPEKNLLKDYDILWGLPQHLWHFDIDSLKVLTQQINCTILNSGYITIPTVHCSIQLYARRKNFPKWLISTLENPLILMLMMTFQVFFPNNAVWIICKNNNAISAKREFT